MNLKPAHYSPIAEVTTAWLLGIISFLVVGTIVAEIALPIVSGLNGSIVKAIQHDGIWTAIGRGLAIAALLPFGAAFWAIALIALSMPQFVLIVLPMAHFGSKGLVRDAARGWAFYGLTGAMVGMLPWIFIILCTSKAPLTVRAFLDLGAVFALFAPALFSGLFGGLVLKYQLTRLAASGIENSIK
jgi:hypothetical protein